MARLLEALKQQGIEITEAVETELLKEFAEKKELELKDSELKDLKEQLVKRDTDIEELKKAKPEDLSPKLEELQKKYDDEKIANEKNLEAAKLEGQLKVELIKTGTKDIEILSNIVDKTQLRLDKDGKMSGLAEQLETIKKEKAFLFDAVETNGQNAKYEYKPVGKETETQVNTGNLGDAIAERMGLQ